MLQENNDSDLTVNDSSICSDDKLLELAAKAYGIDWEYVLRDNGSFIENGRVWNPLINDGDALRLAVKLKLSIKTPNIDSCIIKDRNNHMLWIETGPDFEKITRRAIVVAAARTNWYHE